MTVGKRLLITLLLSLLPVALWAQVYDTVSVFSQPVQLDSFVIKSGFDVNAFIARVRTDTTFYKAFKNMRFVPYTAVNDIIVLGRSGQATAWWHSTTVQERTGNCRVTKVSEQKSTGDFFKRNGGYNYYTAELFAYLFLSPKPVCNESEVIAGGLEQGGGGQMQKREYQLKQLIFNPGAKVSGIPFMGDRASIFEKGEAEKYDFRITREVLDGTQCYRFSILPKPGNEKKVLYNELVTWFRQSDYSIVARNYSLSYHTMVYDFDVKMKVRTAQRGTKLYPTWVSYDGNWHVFTKKRERVKFTVAVTY
ncbi:MAG: hypothetical protein V4649_13560 [Bacteroidota bacterium]